VRQNPYVAAFLVMALSTVGCSALIEDIPDSSPTHPSSGSVSAPPAPGGTGTPAPTAEPTPTPNDGTDDPDDPGPNPTQPPPSSSCFLGRGTGDGESCPRRSPSFLSQVTNAIKKVQTQKPGWFTNGGNHVKVQYWDTYYRQVVANLNALGGICARVTQGGEISVKNTNSFTDEYHVLVSSGDIHWGPDSYRATCTPAWW
jgi:hypothetical protein